MRMKALIRDSPDDSQTGGDFYEYPVFCQGGFAARTTAATTGSPDGGRGSDLAIFPGMDALLPSVALEHMTIGLLTQATVATAPDSAADRGTTVRMKLARL